MSGGGKRCQSCDAAVIWAWSPDDERLILDAGPHEKGVYVLEHEGVIGGSGEGHTLTRAVKTDPPSDDQEPLFGGQDDRPRYRSHWKTCPQAGSWSGKKRKAASA